MWYAAFRVFVAFFFARVRVYKWRVLETHKFVLSCSTSLLTHPRTWIQIGTAVKSFTNSYLISLFVIIRIERWVLSTGVFQIISLVFSIVECSCNNLLFESNRKFFGQFSFWHFQKTLVVKRFYLLCLSALRTSTATWAFFNSSDYNGFCTKKSPITVAENIHSKTLPQHGKVEKKEEFADSHHRVTRILSNNWESPSTSN